jgi:hypothetical protein
MAGQVTTVACHVHVAAHDPSIPQPWQCSHTNMDATHTKGPQTTCSLLACCTLPDPASFVKTPLRVSLQEG